MSRRFRTLLFVTLSGLALASSASAQSTQIEVHFERRDADRQLEGGDKGKEFVADQSEVNLVTGERSLSQTEIVGRKTAGGGRVQDLTNDEGGGFVDVYGYKTRNDPGLTELVEPGFVIDELVSEGFRFNKNHFGVDKSGKLKNAGYSGDEGESGGAKEFNPFELLVFDFSDDSFVPSKIVLTVKRSAKRDTQTEDAIRGMILPLDSDGADVYRVTDTVVDYTFSVPVDEDLQTGEATFAVPDPFATAFGLVLFPGEAARVRVSFIAEPSIFLCGNGEVDPGEECDGGDGCTPTCTLEPCGNGTVDAGEECDDGNLVSGDGCSGACTAEVCGNGTVDAGEECDGGDGCSDACLLEVCGNAIVDPGEECDDGGTEPNDGCSPECLEETVFCGNGLIDGDEECDDGDDIGNDGCTLCTCDPEAVCGDGNLCAKEECDDANEVSGDGCSSTCMLEVCGNGVLDEGEDCDDGNTVDGDECAADCLATCPLWNGGSDSFMGATSLRSFWLLATKAADLQTCEDADECSGADRENVTASEAFCREGETTVFTSVTYVPESSPSVSRASWTVGSQTVSRNGNQVSLPEIASCARDHLEFTPIAEEQAGSSGTTGTDACGLPFPLTCGNGVVEDAEECDDRNSIDGDGCTGCELDDTATCPCWNGGSNAFRGARSITEFYDLAATELGISECEQSDVCEDEDDRSIALCTEPATVDSPSKSAFTAVEVNPDDPDSYQCRWGVGEGSGTGPQVTLTALSEVQQDACWRDHRDFTPPDAGRTDACGLPFIGTCGNGVVEDGEECDDENDVDGDGCNGACQFDATECPCWDGGPDSFMGANGVPAFFANVLEQYSISDCNELDVCSESQDAGAAACGDGRTVVEVRAAPTLCSWTVAEDGIADREERRLVVSEIQGASCLADVKVFTPIDRGSTQFCGLPFPANCGDGVVDSGEECDDDNNVDGDGCNAMCELEASFAVGDVVEVDFGTLPTAGFGSVTDCTEGEASALLNTSGDPSPVHVRISAFGGSNENGVADNGLGWPATVTRDQCFVGSFDGHDAALLETATVTLSNLEPGTYTLTLFASRAGDDGGRGRLTRFTTGGTSQDLEVTDNAGSVATFADLSPDSSGAIEITVSVSPVGSARFAHLGALRVIRTGAL